MVSDMTFTPTPVPAEDRPRDEDRRRYAYAWDAIQLGVWQRWLDLHTAEGRTAWELPPDRELTDVEAMRHCTRIRVAAKWHADTHQLKVESRRKDHGRILDLRFTRES